LRRRKEEEEEEKNSKNKRSSSCRPQQKSNHRLQHVADYQPGDCLKDRTQIFILLSFQPVQQKVDHEAVFLYFWIYQYSTFGYCYPHVGLNIPAEISGSFW